MEVIVVENDFKIYYFLVFCSLDHSTSRKAKKKLAVNVLISVIL